LEKKIFFIIIIGLTFSILLSIFNIKTFDKYSTDIYGAERHSMIKSDIFYHYNEANLLKEELNQGKNYFETGSSYENHYLPSKIFFIYSLLTKQEIFTKDQIYKVPINDKKIFLLFFQGIFYYLCVYFFANELKKKVNNKILFFIIAFLSIEPTILQWHSTFWTESIFLSLQLIFFTLIIKDSTKNSKFLILGLLLGLMFLQRSAATFYLFPLLIYFFIILKNPKEKIAFFLFGYLFFLGILGYHNFKRSGVFYLTPGTQKVAFSQYMLPTIISNNEKISTKEAKEKIKNQKLLLIYENNLDINNEKDYVKYSSLVRNYTFSYFLKNPIYTFKHVIKKSMHYATFDPVWSHYFHIFHHSGKSYYNSSSHKFWVKYRLIYATIIYTIILIGIIKSPKKLNLHLNLFTILSLSYFFLVLCWIGFTRYFTPCLIYLSIYFGAGSESLLNFKKNYL
jgi:4-amino-4-deoxy-L-arabinose transferase-like glycosyltransferase